MALTTRTKTIMQVALTDRKAAAELEAAVDLNTSFNVVSLRQDTTGTGAAAGQIAVPGMTATGKVIVTGAEAVTGGVGYVIAGTGLFTVYAGGGTAVDTKKINYVVLSLT